MEMGDKIMAINGQSVDNLVTDEVGARLKQRSFFLTYARSSTDTIQMLVNFLTQVGFQDGNASKNSDWLIRNIFWKPISKQILTNKQYKCYRTDLLFLKVNNI